MPGRPVRVCRDDTRRLMRRLQPPRRGGHSSGAMATMARHCWRAIVAQSLSSCSSWLSDNRSVRRRRPRHEPAGSSRSSTRADRCAAGTGPAPHHRSSSMSPCTSRARGSTPAIALLGSATLSPAARAPARLVEQAARSVELLLPRREDELLAALTAVKGLVRVTHADS
jgi:hypothetical protein